MEEFIIKEVPSTAYYVPNFITKEEEEILLKEIYKAPKPKWVQLANRRLQNWGGLPHPKGMVSEKMPTWLSKYIDKIAQLNVFEDKKPNHVLVNEYEAGQGIMPHEDGPLFYPTITTINVGSSTVLEFYEKIPDATTNVREANLEERFLTSLFLEPRSLLILKHQMYTDYLHSISERTRDLICSDKIANLQACKALKDGEIVERGTRISLTIRHVPKTIKIRF